MSGLILRQHGDQHRPPGWNSSTDPGAPDPLRWLKPSVRTTAALLHDITFAAAGDEDVAADTWELITTSTNGRSFLEGWRLDSGWTVSATGGSGGNFQRSEFALYEAWASVEFGDAVEGDKIGVAIQFSNSADFFYPNVNVCEEDEGRVIVCAHHWGTLSTPVKFWCYASVVRAIRQCELFIRRFELSDDGEILDFS